MGRIFLSYAKDDAARVMPLVNFLTQHGHSVWWDKNLTVGSAFDQKIEEEMNACDVAIVAWSQRSVESNWVRSEAAAALEQSKMVPVRIDACTIPLQFKMIHTANLSEWDGVTLTDDVRDLLARVNGVGAAPAHHVTAPGAPPAPAKLSPLTIGLGIAFVAVTLGLLIWGVASAIRLALQ